MPSLTSSLPFSPAELAYLHSSLSSVPPLRPDARPLATDFRPLRAETGVLPSVNGSAHVGFSDGREAIVGVKLEVERSAQPQPSKSDGGDGDGAMEVDDNTTQRSSRAESSWVTLTLTLPGLRDDDANLAFLEEMLREPLLSSAEGDHLGLADRLAINSRWHWHIYIDVLLVSPGGGGGTGLSTYPLPLLSMAAHLALRDTRVPRLKSEGEEDPVADDDWMASTFLYPRGSGSGVRPPITLLVVVVGENVMFDPSREELAVADGIVAVSVGVGVGGDGTNKGDIKAPGACELLAVRMVDTPARDTMTGVQTGEMEQEVEPPAPVDVPGVWNPRVGGIKRAVLKNVVRTVITDGVARDVMAALDGFLTGESEG
jgi:exosome complex component RRP42